MTAHQLDQPVVAGSALRSVNFFNGRLLTGDDLSLEQSTTEARLERVGRLVGTGVAFGFEVQASLASTIAAPVVTVGAGLAVARSGASLELSVASDVSLYTNDPSARAGPGGLFADCQPAAPGTYSAGSGVYLLVVGPAQQPEGLAQVSGLGNQAATCNVARSAEALKFRLIRAAVAPDVVADVQHLRNRVAALCFDYEAIAAFISDPFGPEPASYGLIDTLRSQVLTDDEVPLAAIGWSVDTGIQFVDLWSVRRRLIRPAPEDGWTSFVSDRRRAEAEAIFLQFQAHLGDLLSGPSPESLALENNFERLPPIGLLPTPGDTRPGVDIDTFFGGIATRGPFVIEGARVESLVRMALPFAPIDLSLGEPIWLYSLRENLDPRAWTVTPGGACVLFTSGFVPHAGNAQYSLAHWNYANYALHVT